MAQTRTGQRMVLDNINILKGLSFTKLTITIKVIEACEIFRRTDNWPDFSICLWVVCKSYVSVIITYKSVFFKKKKIIIILSFLSCSPYLMYGLHKSASESCSWFCWVERHSGRQQYNTLSCLKPYFQKKMYFSNKAMQMFYIALFHLFFKPPRKRLFLAPQMSHTPGR